MNSYFSETGFGLGVLIVSLWIVYLTGLLGQLLLGQFYVIRRSRSDNNTASNLLVVG